MAPRQPLPSPDDGGIWSAPYGTPVMDEAVRQGLLRLRGAGKRPNMKKDNPLFNLSLLQDAVSGGTQVATAPIAGLLAPFMPAVRKAMDALGSAPGPQALGPVSGWTGDKGKRPQTLGEGVTGLLSTAKSGIEAGADYMNYPRDQAIELVTAGASALTPSLLRNAAKVPGKLEAVANDFGYGIGPGPDAKNAMYSLVGAASPVHKLEGHNKTLAQAKKLKRQGVADDVIQKETGWFKIPNGRWSREISDADAEVAVHFPQLGEQPFKTKSGKTSVPWKSGSQYDVGEVWDHPEYYRQVQNVENAGLLFKDSDSTGGAAQGLLHTMKDPVTGKEKRIYAPRADTRRNAIDRKPLITAELERAIMPSLGFRTVFPATEAYTKKAVDSGLKPLTVKGADGNEYPWSEAGPTANRISGIHRDQLPDKPDDPMTGDQLRARLKGIFAHEIGGHASTYSHGLLGPRRASQRTERGATGNLDQSGKWSNYITSQMESLARNVDRRSWMTDEQLRGVPFASTYDIPQEAQLRGAPMPTHTLKQGAGDYSNVNGAASFMMSDLDQLPDNAPRRGSGTINTDGEPKKKAPTPKDMISVSTARRQGIRPSVTAPVRVAYPNVYKPPSEIVFDASRRIAPEHPGLMGLFGLNRGDLAEQYKEVRGILRPNAPGLFKPGARGSAHSANVATDRNADRLLGQMQAGMRQLPDMMNPMSAWYYMTPAFDKLVNEVGPDEAARLMRDFNGFTSNASPGSDVMTELNRGTHANMMHQLGRFDEFEQYGGQPLHQRGADFPGILSANSGHPYHRTSQLPGMQRYRDTGTVASDNAPKVPSYYAASGVPMEKPGSNIGYEMQYNTQFPVGDAHWARGVGLPDVRQGMTGIGGSAKTPEMMTLTPWYEQSIARELGVHPVSAQAMQWGLLSPQTGVNTAVGSPKLELLAQAVWETAIRRGVDPHGLLIRVLKGQDTLGSAQNVKVMDDD